LKLIKYIVILLIFSFSLNDVMAYKNRSSLNNKACYKSALNEYEQIKNNAKLEWPNNYSLQKFEIERQKKAYKDLCSVAIMHTGRKGSAYKKIKQRAWDEWHPNFSLIQYQYNKEVAAYNSLNSRY